MKKLSDILANGSGDNIRQQWNDTQAAGELELLPPGKYVARIVAGELETSRTNATPGYKLKFKILEGEQAGRNFYHDLWLTPAALPMAKRDLAKIGVTHLEQLDSPLPQGIRCHVELVVRRDDDGNERNRVRRFDVEGIDTPEPDAFAPAATVQPHDANGEGGGDES